VALVIKHMEYRHTVVVCIENRHSSFQPRVT